MAQSQLNLEQKAAASAPSGYNLIIASAGTGKTSTIVGRISHLLHNGVSPHKILLLTFTNKASQEMIERVARFFNPQIAQNIESGTFHAVAYRYVKQHTNIRLKQPKELKMLFRSVYEKRVFLNRSNQPPYSAQYLYDIYSLFLNSGCKDGFTKWIIQKMPTQEIYTEIYEDVLQEFKELKKLHNYADYNDLLLLYKEEISKNPPNFAEVLCDEYQDTNPLQDSILKALNPKSLFCVGDYDQSIYAFNGADISIISNFIQTYPNARVFSLSKNYRSSQQILSLANEVIQHNQRIYPKKLEVIKQGNFSAPKLLGFDELFLQYQGIAQHIAHSNCKHTETAIIFRNNSSADGIEASLRTLNIPCKRKGSSSFFESKEVVLMLDLCTILTHPSDMMAYINVLSYGKGIGSSMAKDLFESFVRLGNGIALQGVFEPNSTIPAYEKKSKNTQLGLFDDFFNLQAKERFDSILHAGFASHPIFEHPKLNLQSAEFLNEFYILLHTNKTLTIPKHLIMQIAKSEFFQKITQNIAKERAKNKDGNIDSQRLQKAQENIKRKIMLLYDLSCNYQDMRAFLNAMVLISTEASEGSGINLLSVHASKGLEFKNVYVVDLMEGRFPNLKLVTKGGSIEEERRLFYVAVTRAKENLILSYATKDMIKNIEYTPSRFLYEAKLLAN
ncbi:MAG: ATP-dependent helicase [Helicobacter sp.]|nr:ATP-dependent helicase [Helicobacter sp.]MDY5741332.1 ATP-dependent helicase [Helicobacter sp.]